METITFAKMIENSVNGAELVRTDWQGNEERGIWTGKTYTAEDGRVMTYVVNLKKQILSPCRFENETDWQPVLDGTGTPAGFTGVPALMAEIAADERISYVRLNRALGTAQKALDNLKRDASSALAEWAESNIDDDEKRQEFSELLESLGFEGLKRSYNVVLRVTYSVEFEVEATSEDNARELVDQDTCDYVSDNIDISYYDDYEITEVNESGSGS